MGEYDVCLVNNYPTELQTIGEEATPAKILVKDYKELLIERAIIDPSGKEIQGRLTKLVKQALKDAKQNRCKGEPLSRAVVRHALRRLNYAFAKTTLGGIPTGPAYERNIPSGITPQGFGHEKVGYQMSQYPDLSYLPVGGLGTPMCEVDYATCYLKEGHMIQDKPIRKLTVEINGQVYDLAEANGTYYALYPFSERTYNLASISVSILQYSPVIPGNYQVSSLPVEIMEVVIENPTDKPIKVTFTITQDNILGWYPKKGEDNPQDPSGILVWDRQNEGNYSETYSRGSISGVVFRRNGAIAKSLFSSFGDKEELIWDALKNSGYIDEKGVLQPKFDGKRENFRLNDSLTAEEQSKIFDILQQAQKRNWKNFVRVGSGIAGQIALASQKISGKVDVAPVSAGNAAGLTITLTLQPKEKITQPLVVVYDDPFYNFQHDATDPNSPGVRMPKFYTRFYDATGQNAVKIAEDALENYGAWRKKIVDFQAQILNDPDLPDFFKQALLNELYVLAETGIWEADQGRFAYLESIDYKMYNTSDVNSYTWAILTLFPELERKDLLEFAKLVPLADPRRRWWGTDRWANIPPEQWKHLYWAPVKDPGAVCHDLGGLLGEGIFPFTNTCNEFNWSNADMWIDLAPKFALRVWRYHYFMVMQTRDMDLEFLRTVFPAVKMGLDTLERRWGDKKTHIPISKGVPDWTYDTISGKGYTPNVVTQWLGALQAAAAIAMMLDDFDTAQKYMSWFNAGKPELDQLWNSNGYYNAFTTPDGAQVNASIHSDMLFGDFYVRMTGLKPVVPDDRAAQALETIYRVNGETWSQVGNHGPLGLVNLRGSQGKQDRSEQGDEGWTGTMLLNAANQILVGRQTNNPKLVRNGWNIVHGFFNVVYSHSPDSQHWFGRTPEGYVNPDDIKYDDKEGKKKYREGKVLADGTVVPATGRAPKYMRALAIWAIYAALKGNKMPFNFYNQRIPNLEDTFPEPFGK